MLNMEYDVEIEKKVLREEGREEGRKEAQWDIAYAMLSKGVDVHLIVETTGLSLEAINNMKNPIFTAK